MLAPLPLSGLRSGRAPAVLLPALCLLLAACGTQKAATPPRAGLSNPLEGHVYLAQLMSGHPLFPAAQRLAAEISRLEQAAVPAIGSGVGEGWLSPLYLGPAPGVFPRDAFLRDWRTWQAGLLTPAPLETVGLPPDLEAAREWRYRQIELEQAAQMAQARAAESRVLARLRESLVRERMEELTNAGLDLSVPPAEAARREEEIHRRIWDQIEATVAREQAQAEQKRLPAIQARLDAETARRKAEVDAQVQAEARLRQESVLPELVEPRQRMEARVARFADLPFGPEQPAQLGGLAPSVTDLATAERARDEALAHYQQTRLEQIQRLKRSQAALVRLILADVRLAAMRVAFQDNLRLSLVPPGSAFGANLTDRVSRRAQQIWSGRDRLFTGGAEETDRR